MKKTVTVTFHAPNNNGAFLQAFALHKFLNSCEGVSNEILNYQSDASKSMDQLFRKITSVSDILRIMVSTVCYSKLKLRNSRFEEMRKNHLRMTPFTNDEREAVALANNYDAAIFGSDQIWNPQIKDFSELYFGKDIRCKKIAYAASCGPRIEEKDIRDFGQYIKQYDAIATRETASATLINSLFQKQATVTIDPTLLLNAPDYDELYSKTPIIKGKYIFLYTINYNQSVLEQAKRISKLLDMPVFTVFASYHSILCIPYGIQLLWDAGPAEFLNLIKNAEVVVTNSFHGTAFSIIFRKDFYHVCEVDSDGEIRDDRIHSLLETFGLHQTISRDSSNEELLSKKSVDYLETDRIHDKVRAESIEYLLKSLS